MMKIVGILCLFCCLSIHLNGQQNRIIQLIAKDCDPTCEKKNHTVDVNLIEVRDSIATQYLLGSNSFLKVFDFGLHWILPRDQEIQFQARAFYSDYFKPLGITRSEGRYFLAVDNDFNGKFEPKEWQEVNLGNDLKMTFIAHTKDGIALKVPFLVNVQMVNGSLEVKVKSLLYFELKESFGDSILALNIMTNFLNCNFNFVQETNKSDQKVQNYYLNEPFLFLDTFRILKNLDLINNTIDFITLEEEFKPIGRKIGYFIDMKDFHSVLKESIFTKKQFIDLSSDYFVLHFWGPWCKPCMEEISNYNVLEKRLANTKLFSVIHFATLFNEKEIDFLENTIDEHQIKGIQVLQLLSSHNTPISSKNRMIRSLSIDTFPSLFIINKQGKILFIGQKADLDFYEFMTSLDPLYPR